MSGALYTAIVRPSRGEIRARRAPSGLGVTPTPPQLAAQPVHSWRARFRSASDWWDMIWRQIGVIFLLLLLNGFFAMSEMALVSSKRSRLQSLAEQGKSGAKSALT